MASSCPVKVYRTVSSFPTVEAGWLVRRNEKDRLVVYTHSSLRQMEDTVVPETRRIRDMFMEVPDGCGHRTFFHAPFPFDTTSVAPACWAPSPCNRLLAVIRPASEEPKETEKMVVEVWNKNHLVCSVSTEDIHGKAAADERFQRVAWASDSSCFVYVAETKSPVATGFFGGTTKTPALPPGSKWEWKDDWGEQYTGCRQPSIFLFDVKTATIREVKGLPEHMSMAQPLFWPQGRGIVFSAFPNDPFRLGLKFCLTRPCSLFSLSLDNSGDIPTAIQLSPEGCNARSPCFSPDGRTLIYLSTPSGAQTHNATHVLRKIPWSVEGSCPDGHDTVVIDVVEGPVPVDEFPGLYLSHLPRRCWLNDSRHIVVSSLWRCHMVILLIDTQKGSLKRISHGKGSWTVLDVDGWCLLVENSSPVLPSHAVFIELDPSLSVPSQTDWIPLRIPDQERAPVSLPSTLTWDVLTVAYQDTAPHASFDAILVYPKEAISRRYPLVVTPHGGPHSAHVVEYQPSTAFLVSLGYLVLQVNYRGSVGYGEASIQSLPGKIGVQDVQDIQMAIKAVDERLHAECDHKFLLGGSHGGFLVAHLIGQFPNMFKASVMRNPVIDIAGMQGTTDIDDWCFVESGIPYPSPRDSHAVQTMFSCSPSSRIAFIRTPTLICLGTNDRRVPPSQGLYLHRCLLRNGVRTRLLLYDNDNHSLSHADHEADFWINAARWFQDVKGDA